MLIDIAFWMRLRDADLDDGNAYLCGTFCITERSILVGDLGASLFQFCQQRLTPLCIGVLQGLRIEDTADAAAKAFLVLDSPE